MGLKIMIPYLLVCYLFFYCKWIEGFRNLSKEEYFELDEQLKRFNKPPVKTIKTKYGDIYDCVDFYKQYAFDHPLLNNHNFHPEVCFHPEMLSTSNPRRVSSRKKVPKLDFEPVNIGLEGRGCPVGTVPIRRTTKDDLIRAKVYSKMHASKINPLTDDKPGTHYAVALTKKNINYDGVGAELSVWNIPVQASQYTSGRIKISNGAESIEAGWTVNPGLYGDSRTHLYIYTNAGQSHCFNAQCGYVHLSREMPLDTVLDPVSSYGGKQYGITLSIVREGGKQSKWLLQWDDPPVNLGFWPGQLFTNLGNTATRVEWGGEVFGPPNVPLPGMGSGHPLRVNTRYDAFCGRAHIVVNNTIINPSTADLDILFDNYGIDYRDVGGAPQFLVFYGGAGGATEIDIRFDSSYVLYIY